MNVVLLANTDWYLYNFRRALAQYLVDKGHEVVLASPDGEFRSKLLESGFNHVIVPIDRKPSITLQDLSALVRLCRLYLSFRPDVVHHFTIKAVFCGMLVAKLVRVPKCVNSLTGLGYAFTDDGGKRARVIQLMIRLMLRISLSGRRVETIVQNQVDMATLLANHLGCREKMHLIPGSGVNLSHFSPTLKPQNSPVTVLMASRYLYDKGIREYLAAAEVILTNRNDVEFLLAGSPDPGNPTSISTTELEELTRMRGLKELGYHHNVIKLFQEADIVVLPSYREGLPRSLLEAASCGLPIVTTNVPGCNDVVVDKVNGFLVPARSVTPLVDAICTLVESSNLRAKMGFAGRQRVKKYFSEDIVLAQTFSVYQISRDS